MATTFVLPNPGNIRGDQLADEVLAATGIDVSDRYTFRPPDTVTIAGEDVVAAQAAIQAVIDAHEPQAVYSDVDRERITRAAAEQGARNIPGWATWTAAEAGAWFDANIADLLAAVPDVDGLTAQQYLNNAQAIDAQWQDIITAQAAVIRALGQMVIALRSEVWPRLGVEGDAVRRGDGVMGA